MSTTNGDGTSLAPLGATPRSRPPSITPTQHIGRHHQQQSYHYASPPYYMGESGLLLQGSPCGSFDYPFTSNPVEWAHTQTYGSYLDPCGYTGAPLEPVPIHSNIFDGGYPPVTLFEYSAAEVSGTPLSARTTYAGHQPLVSPPSTLPLWGLVRYRQNSFKENDRAVLDNYYGGSSQFTPYLANQTHVSSNERLEPSPSIESLGPHSSLSSAYDSSMLIGDSPRGNCIDLSLYLRDRAPPNVHPQLVDRVPPVSGPTPSASVDPPEHIVSPVSSPRRRPTRCQPDLAHAPQHLRKALELLLSLIQDPESFGIHEVEPTVDEARAQLLEVKNQTGVSLGKDARGRDSIYSLFADRASNEVWLCGHAKGNLSRAVGHVRSILNHRPFPCLGRSGGCDSRRCARPGMTVSFFTKAMRDDHMKRSANKERCLQGGCGKWIRKRGMSRHLKIHLSASSASS